MTTSTPLAEPGPETLRRRISIHSMEHAISLTLRGGVLTAAAIILAGVVLFVGGHRSPGAPRSFTDLIHTKASAVGLEAIIRGSFRLDAIAIIEFGVFVLILTPVVRVAMTAMVFAIDRDPVFLVIVCIVLAVLILGLTGVVG